MLEPVAQFNGTLWLAVSGISRRFGGGRRCAGVVGLAPLRDLRRALGQIHSGKTQRLEGQFPMEVTPLIEDFNQVLAQNAQVVGACPHPCG
jgi:hypothetical protein